MLEVLSLVLIGAGVLASLVGLGVELRARPRRRQTGEESSTVLLLLLVVTAVALAGVLLTRLAGRV